MNRRNLLQILGAGIAALVVPKTTTGILQPPKPSSATPGPEVTIVTPTAPNLAIPDEVLHSLCGEVNSHDFGEYATAMQCVQDVQHNRLMNNPLSSVLGGRTPLNDRLPIFGKEDGFVTREMVGCNYRGGRRVTVPTFDICAIPRLKAEVILNHDVAKLQDILWESAAAISRTELLYFTDLLEAVYHANPAYGKTRMTGPLTSTYLLEQAARMKAKGVTAKAIFLTASDINELHYNSGDIHWVWEGAEIASAPRFPFTVSLRGILNGIHLIEVDERELQLQAIHIFGQPEDPRLTTAHLVDNTFEFRIKHYNKEPRNLRQVENVGFLIAAPTGCLTIERSGRWPSAKKTNRINAYLVGEEGEDVICDV